MTQKKDFTYNDLKAIALALNESRGGNITTDEFLKTNYELSRKTWSRKIQGTGIYFDKDSAMYVISEDIPEGQESFINDVFIADESQSTKKPQSKKDQEPKPIRIPANTIRKKVGRPQLHEEGDLLKKTFIITPAIDKALKLKAVNEGIGVNELVRAILTAAIEDKYFKGL